MPAGLELLPDLALNLRWSWSHAADRLWQAIAPDIWAATRNPWLLLQTVPESRLEECSRDPAILDSLAQIAALRVEYMTQASWCSRCAPADPPLTAYFCAEFGIAEALPLYAGGLGILAGDTLKTASDMGVPMIGVGLLYSQGYFRQTVDAAGDQHELFPPNTPGLLPIVPALDPAGMPLIIPLPLPGRELTVRVWQAQVGRVPLLLLDCNDPRNSAVDRGITGTLYPAGLEPRLTQQLVLGIAGWRALIRLGHAPQVCHFNEGHCALAAFERARALAQAQKIGFEAALWATRAGNVFTTHTPVAAAFDAFPAELMLRYMRPFLAEAGMAADAFMALGRSPDHHGQAFIPTLFALRTCGRINGVSRAHGEVSRQLFRHLYPRRPVHEVPVRHITNGVHVPSWDSAWADEVWTRACGKPRWLGAPEQLTSPVQAIDDGTLWELRGRERRDLVDYARLRLARQLGQRGQEGAMPQAAFRALDPNALTLGFARRFTGYKRPNLLLSDPARLARLLSEPRRPVQLILAGKAHPQDAPGKAMIREWVRFALRPDMRGRVVFLEDYDIDLAQQLVQGIDVWINTPRRPWEACGTSGMKVLVNGGLNLSELDGWWAAAWSPEVGWALPDGSSGDNQDADALYRLLEQEVVPAFYERGADGVAHRWVTMMRASMATLAPRFSSNRMLREYFETAYCPAAAALARRLQDGGKLASSLKSWADSLRACWNQIHFDKLDCQRDGDRLRFTVHVYLGEIPVEGVAVELYADPPSGGSAVVCRMERSAAISGATNAHIFTAEVGNARPPGDFTPRVVPFHPEASIPLELELICWYSPGA